MKKALGITRVSSTDQAKDERYSIPHQKIHITSECKQRHIDLVDFLEFVQKGDRVMSRTAKERDAVLKAIKDHGVEIVIVHELDRLARSALDTLLFVDELDRQGVSFISIHDGFDTTTAQGRLQMQILSAFSEYFRKQLAAKVLGGLTERAKQGLPMGKRPFGRNITPTGFIINEKEADTIRLMAKMYLKDNIGDRGIAEKLNMTDIRPQNGGHWSHQAVRDILDNENNTSTFVWGEIRVENALEPILDDETYRQIVERRKIKSKLGGRAQNNNFLLSGLLRCTQCDGSLVGHTSSKGKYIYRYYICTNYMAKGRTVCPGGWFRADIMEGKVLADIESLSKGKTIINYELIPSDILDLQTEIITKQKEIQLCKTRLERAAAAYESGEYDIDFFRQRRSKLKEQQDVLYREIIQIKSQIKKRLDPDELMKRLVNKVQQASDIPKETDIQKMKSRLQGLIDHIDVRAADDLTIYYRI